MNYVLRLKITAPMGLLMIDLGLADELGIDASRSMLMTARSILLTAEDCREILNCVPRIGRTGIALRRRTAALLNQFEGNA